MFVLCHQAVDAFTGEPAPLEGEISAYHDGGSRAAAKVAELAKIDAEAKGLGITENTHTKYTVPILESKNR